MDEFREELFWSTHSWGMSISTTTSATSSLVWSLLFLGCSTRVELAQFEDAGGNSSATSNASGATTGVGGATHGTSVSSGLPIGGSIATVSGGASALPMGGGSGWTAGGGELQSKGGGSAVSTGGKSSTAKGGSSSPNTGGSSGSNLGGAAPLPSGGSTTLGVAGAFAQFCTGDAKVNYKNTIHLPQVTRFHPVNDRNCCLGYGMQLHTREAIGFDLFIEAWDGAWLRAPGDFTVGFATSRWNVDAYTSPNRSTPMNVASGVLSLRGESPTSSPWQMGVCLTFEDPSAELGGTQIFVPPVAMDYPGMQNRFAIWLLSDSSITAFAASQLPLESLTLAGTPLLNLNGIDYIEQSTGWLALSPGYVDGESLRKSLGTVPLYGLPFVVTADSERVYLGGFFSAISSVAIPGPEVIVENMKPEGFPLLAPVQGPTPVSDQRSDPRIVKVLQETGRYLP